MSSTCPSIEYYVPTLHWQQKLPSDWLGATIAPVLKKGDVHQHKNYMLVSLTCVSGKLLEHIICKQLLEYI